MEKTNAPRIAVLSCPVCGAPLEPDAPRCRYCGSVVVIETDHPRIDPLRLNKAVIDDRIAEYRASVRRDPNDEAAHYGLGVAYFNLGLLADAARELAEAARLMPENPHIQMQLAVVYSEMDDGDCPDADARAWDRLNRARVLGLSSVDSHLMGAELRLRRGEPIEAVVEWGAAFEEDADSIRAPIASFLKENESTFLGLEEYWPRSRRFWGYKRRAVGLALVGIVLTVLSGATGDGATSRFTPWLLLATIAVPLVVWRNGPRRDAERYERLLSTPYEESTPYFEGTVEDAEQLMNAAADVARVLTDGE